MDASKNKISKFMKFADMYSGVCFCVSPLPIFFSKEMWQINIRFSLDLKYDAIMCWMACVYVISGIAYCILVSRLQHSPCK